MNKGSAVFVAVCAAVLAAWLMKPDGSQRPLVSFATPQRSAFLDGSPILVAMDGTCGTQADLSPSLLGGGTGDAEAPASPSSVESGPAAGTAGAAPGEPPVEAASAQPGGGTCGGHTESSVADAPPEKIAPSQHEAVAEHPSAKEHAPAVKERAPAVVASLSTKLKPARVQVPQGPMTAWWPAHKADALNVVFVGEAAFGSAITILTDGTFENADSANAHIQVRTTNATRVERRWQVATNPRMLLLPVTPGVYTISIEPQFTDARGRQAGSASSGPVYVR